MGEYFPMLPFAIAHKLKKNENEIADTLFRLAKQGLV